jgi:hypothetical protein
MLPVTSPDPGDELLVMIFDTPLPAAPRVTLQSFPPGFVSSVMGFTPNIKDGIRAKCSVRAGEISCFSDLGLCPKRMSTKPVFILRQSTRSPSFGAASLNVKP